MTLDLQQIERRAAAASPADEWRGNLLEDGPNYGMRQRDPADDGRFYSGTPCPDVASVEQAEADCLFAVHARTDIPALVAEVRVLRTTLECAAESLNAQLADITRLREALESIKRIAAFNPAKAPTIVAMCDDALAVERESQR